MIRKFNVSLKRQQIHNKITINPLIDEFVIHAIYIFDVEGQRIDLLDNSIKMSSDRVIKSKISIRYPTVSSSAIFFDIEADYINQLDISDILSASIFFSRFKRSGQFKSETKRIRCYQELIPIFELENIDDALVEATLNLKIYDRYGNITIQDIIPVSLNEDIRLVKFITEQTNKIKIDPEPVSNGEDIRVFLSNGLAEVSKDLLSYKDGILTVSGDPINDAFISYTPIYKEIDGYYKINDFLSINRNQIIQVESKDRYWCEFYYNLRIADLSFSNKNNTPVLKKLGLISSSD